MLYDDRDMQLLDGIDAPPAAADKKDVKSALESLIQRMEAEEDTLRQQDLQEIRRNEFYFEGEQNIVWDEVSRAYLTAKDAYRDGLMSDDEFEEITNKINIVRAHGEAIIAASSVEVPKVHYFPADASKPQDIATARAYNKIEKRISLINDARKLIRRTFFVLWKEHFAAAYIRAHRDKKYGVIHREVYKPIIEMVDKQVCPECGSEIPPETQPYQGAPEVEPLENEVGPLDGPIQDGPPDPFMGGPDEMSMPVECPTCMEIVTPQPHQEPVESQEKVGEEAIVKCGVKIEVYGSKNVKIPRATSKMEDIPYLIFEREVHRSALLAEYPEYKETDASLDVTGEERRTRLPSQDLRSWPTLKLAWLRPWTFEEFRHNNEDIYNTLKREYPDGALVTLIDGKAVGCEPSSMDDHWHITESTISDTMHAAPICRPLMPVQDMKSELTDLVMETIRHGVPETFADPMVVNFNEYAKNEATPGMMTPARPRPGMTMDNSFYQLKNATLSQEVAPFSAELEAAGQFVVGAFPSIYGGREEAGSETATEYVQSKQQALQRLGINWEMVNSWWPGVVAKGIKLYRANFQGEDHFVERAGGSYRNVSILEEELQGEVGEILPEASAGFPTSWVEKRGMLFNLMEQKIPEVNATIFHPENATRVKDLFGFFEMYVPGEDDRNKQLEEITELLKSGPTAMAPYTDPATQTIVPGSIQATVPTEPEIDDELIHAQTIKAWAVSDQGRKAKLENPEGYKNVLAHLKMHTDSLQAQAMAAPPMDGEETPPNES